MEPFIIEKTGDTPEIVLDPQKNIYRISERSLPENANGFYAPVFQWLGQFSENPPAKVDFEFSMEYFNTASAKQIAKILLILEKLSQKTDVTIIWKHKTEDSDMQASCTRYSKLLNVKFQIEPI